jgi:hypothetical protein
MIEDGDRVLSDGWCTSTEEWCTHQGIRLCRCAEGTESSFGSLKLVQQSSKMIVAGWKRANGFKLMAARWE